jgi:hypothetical protein
MPRRETRHDIERALAEQRRKQRILPPDVQRLVQADVEREMARQRKALRPDEFVEIHVRFRRGVHKLIVKKGRKRGRRGDGSVPALVEPPRGPKPLAGGAAAPLEFD